ncbi:MAG: hypothetical protein MJE66_19690 [Proteobacteria bacterium]|nr:hypothetical protein [Pseudomonadota bacterium]
MLTRIPHRVRRLGPLLLLATVSACASSPELATWQEHYVQASDLWHAGDVEGARAQYATALEALGEKPNRERERALSLTALGGLERELGDTSAARRHLEEAVAILDARAGSAALSPTRAAALANLGATLVQENEPEAARAVLARCLELASQRGDVRTADLALALRAHASLAMLDGQWATAIESLERLRALQGPGGFGDPAARARTLGRLAVAHYREGHVERAEALAQQALDSDASDPEFAADLWVLRTRIDLERVEIGAAKAALTQAISAAEKATALPAPLADELLTLSTRLFLEWGTPDDSARLLDRAALLASRGGSEATAVVEQLGAIGRERAQAGAFEEAERLTQRARDLLIASNGPPELRAQVDLSLAEILLRLDRSDEAEALAAELLTSDAPAAAHARAAALLGTLAEERGDVTLAATHYEAALDSFGESAPGDPWQLAVVTVRRAALAAGAGDVVTATGLRVRSAVLLESLPEEDRGQIDELLALLAEAAAEAPETAAALQRELVWEERVPSPEVARARLLGASARLHRARGRVGDAEQAVSAALEALEEAPDGDAARERAEILVERAATALERGQWRDAGRAAAEARGLLGDDSDAALLLARASQIQARAARSAGQPNEAMSAFGTAIEHARAVPDDAAVGILARSLDELGTLHLGRKRYELARPLFEEAVPAYRRAGLAEELTYPRLLRNLAFTYAQESRFREAAEVNDEAVSILTRTGGTSALDLKLARYFSRQMREQAQATSGAVE